MATPSSEGQRHSGKAADGAKRATVIPDEVLHAPKIGDPFTMDSRTRPNGLGRQKQLPIVSDKGVLSDIQNRLFNLKVLLIRKLNLKTPPPLEYQDV